MSRALLILLIFTSFAYAQKNSEELVDFSSIKDVLQKDRLDESAKIKQEKAEKQRIASERAKKARFNIPDEVDFWEIMSELWLVKNHQILKWDFQKPDFGLEGAFSDFLEKQGLFEKKFRILLLDSPNVTHFALPTSKNSYLFILSLPFIRTLDLSKLEISLLLMEDMVRADAELFKSHVRPTAQSLLGTNYAGSKLDLKKIELVLKKYDEMILDKGFTFSQQFEVTKHMDKTLKNDQELWGTYYRMIRKIDILVKDNSLYRNLPRIYPSPELQLNWLAPPKRKGP
tara:strand:- start:8761 stop:9618 length:858 start_codon:yes stop_codon:yes gene_type:complete